MREKFKWDGKENQEKRRVEKKPPAPILIWFLPSEVEAAVVFPEDEDKEAEELLFPVLRLIQNKTKKALRTSNTSTVTTAPITAPTEASVEAVDLEVDK